MREIDAEPNVVLLAVDGPGRIETMADSGFDVADEAGGAGAGGGGGGGFGTALGGPADRDRDDLRKILAELQVLLGEIVGRDGWLPDELAPHYEAALTAIEDNFHDVDLALAEPRSNARLREVGLLGAPFRLKHSVWEACKGLGQTSKKATALLLRVADTILGTVAVVVPAAEGIIEVKEMVEHGIELKMLRDEAQAREGGETPDL